MSSYNLKYLLEPRSVAVVGATARPGSVGATVIRNLLSGGFRGPVWPVNLRRDSVSGERAYRTVGELPAVPDLAVICTPAGTVPGLIADLGELGTRAAIVLSAGLEEPVAAGRTLGAAMLVAARQCGVRILGPNCIGLLVPGIGLNASFAHVGARPGGIAFVAQSGALTTAMLDWAQAAGVGFSHCISLGNAADVDFGDLLDYLGKDPGTRAILLYIESVSGARKFMSAARAAARNKPVIAVKAGHGGEAARAATSHSGALAGSDAVYDAALRRAGVLRVGTTRQLFEAAQILSLPRPYTGPRLAILSNGGGPAVMATDALTEGGGVLATLSAQTVSKLNALLPTGWSHANPVDIVGDAPPERYVGALAAVLEDPEVDAVLLIHAPTALASTTEVARRCAPWLEKASRPAFACWLGAEGVRSAESTGGGRAIPGYATPEEAVEAFLQVMRYHQVQSLLMETPVSLPPGVPPDIQAVRALISRALTEGRATLTEPESKAILAAYGIPVVETRIARDISELEPLAAAIGYPVALKILSPDISHKSDVGGVALDLANAADLERAGHAMLERCRRLRPEARIEGFTVQKMIRRGGAHELLAGIAVDPTFGPVILFGRGGTAVEVIGDRALGLPPLNSTLTRELISRTRVSRLLAGARGLAAVDLTALESVLVRLAQLATDLAEITELDINPLLADDRGVIALDARVRLAASAVSAVERLAIRPYPSELEEEVEHRGRRLVLRPIRPEDTPQHRKFLARIAPQDMYTRFFSFVRELPPADLAHFTQIDYDREMAFVAAAREASGAEEILGVARACADPDNVAAEFAVLVRSDLKRQGIGKLLMQKLLRYCRERGLQQLWGSVLSENVAMLHLSKSLGFGVRGIDHNVEEIALDLQRERTAVAG